MKIIENVNGEKVIRTLTDQELIDRAVPLETVASDVRKERDYLLTSSDWTQVPDAPVDQAAWRTYRQELRDIPLQEGFPTNVIWPTKPE